MYRKETIFWLKFHHLDKKGAWQVERSGSLPEIALGWIQFEVHVTKVVENVRNLMEKLWQKKTVEELVSALSKFHIDLLF